MATDRFVYVTYIRASQQKVWDALTKPEFLKQYWFGMTQVSTWQKGATWKMKFEDGRTADAGEILESDPPKKLVFKWRNEFRPELKAEGYARCTYTLDAVGETTKLTVLHEMDGENTQFIQAVGGGWPRVLSSLKSFLETGTSLPDAYADKPKT